MKKRTYGTGTLRQLASGKWCFEYKPRWETKRLSKTVEAPTEKAAEKQLADWVEELDRQGAPSVEVSIDDLIELHLSDMRLQGRDPIYIEQVRKRTRKHLSKYFSAVDFAQPLKKAAIKKYANARVEAGAKRATVNRELAALKRAMHLGIDEELIRVPLPKFEKLPENNVRTGEVSEGAYRAIMVHLPEHQQMLWAFAYGLGVRKGELLKLRLEWLLPYWREPEPYIKIPGFDADGRRITKSGQPHIIPLYHPELRAFVAMALSKRDPRCPYLFQYRGRQLKNIRTGFEKACRAAGYPELIFHDTRRTAVGRMEAAGIPREEAMQITGHRTESVYKRYHIGKEKGAIETGRRLREYEEQQAKVRRQAEFANEFANEPDEAKPKTKPTDHPNRLN
jgi:integrase